MLECAVAGPMPPSMTWRRRKTGAERHGHYHRRGGGAGYRSPAQRRDSRAYPVQQGEVSQLTRGSHGGPALWSGEIT